MDRITRHRAEFNAYAASDITDMRRLTNYDKWTVHAIEQAEELIKAAKEYRLELARRARELSTMDSHIKVTLKRERRYDNKVFYFLYIEKVYSDGSAAITENKKYEGKDRHAAINAFREMKKQFPQYEFVEDIAKGRWER